MNRKKVSIKTRINLFKTLLAKDIKSEIRQINDIFSVLLFDIISIFIFSSAYNISTQSQAMALEIFVIQNWVIIFFTLVFIMTRLFVKEKEAGTLGGLISAPVSANTIQLSKIVFCFILLSLIEIVHFIFSFIISNPSIQVLNASQLLYFILFGIIMPTLNLSVCGTIVSALSMYVKNKSFILPILLFPIILPLISPIISTNINLLQGDSLNSIFIEVLFIVSHTILLLSILILVSENLLND